MQETPPSAVGYFELIDCLENPNHESDLEERARSAIESMDNIMQEIPTQFIGTLFYACTVKVSHPGERERGPGLCRLRNF